ncbi:hypothetical protein FKP32DRAFT_1560931 [Trametes sanguinea]|nr:hypothetical protein FKP32DRAFT_1560931 [Trametes sanguinea]
MSLSLESNYTNRILSSLAFAILYYDFVLTIPQEIERFWTRKLSWPSFLFFLNRYLSVIGHIPVIIEFFAVIPESLSCQREVNTHSRRCREYQQYHRVISIIIQGVVAVLMLLRTYALYSRDRRVLTLLLAILGVGTIVSLWVIISGHKARRPTVLPGSIKAADGCDLTLSTQEGYELAIAWSTILVFDGTVFVLTLLQVMKIRQGWNSGGYFHVMLRDGAVLFICYLSNILAYAVAKPIHKGVSTSITNVMSSTLITRFMLNIRDPRLHECPQALEMSETTTV